MKTYNELNQWEKAAIEKALDTLQENLSNVKLANDDRAARAAEALAIYILASKV